MADEELKGAEDSAGNIEETLGYSADNVDKISVKAKQLQGEFMEVRDAVNKINADLRNQY